MSVSISSTKYKEKDYSKLKDAARKVISNSWVNTNGVKVHLDDARLEEL